VAGNVVVGSSTAGRAPDVSIGPVGAEVGRASAAGSTVVGSTGGGPDAAGGRNRMAGSDGGLPGGGTFVGFGGGLLGAWGAGDGMLGCWTLGSAALSVTGRSGRIGRDAPLTTGTDASRPVAGGIGGWSVIGAAGAGDGTGRAVLSASAW
jgi:hypothetical protein